MLINWIIKEFLNKCNNKQHYEFMQLDIKRGHIIERINDIMQLIENDESDELLQQLESAQQEYEAHCKKMNEYAYSVVYA